MSRENAIKEYIKMYTEINNAHMKLIQEYKDNKISIEMYRVYDIRDSTELSLLLQVKRNIFDNEYLN